MIKQIGQIFFAVLLFLVLPSISFAAPIVSGVSGSISDGQNVTITGSSFGSNPLNIEWLGGNTGLIESGTSGQVPSKTRWSFDSSWADTSIATDYAHSGTKSLRNMTSDNSYNGDIRYDSGSNIGPNQDIFASWWVRRSHVGSGQWKMFRLDAVNDIVDAEHQLVMFNWDSQQQFIVRPGPGYSTNEWQDWGPPYPSLDNRWYRIDLLIHTSDIGANNGSYAMNLHDPVSGKTIENMSLANKMSFSDSTGFYRWFLWQNYTGNGVTSQTTWLDDLYIQTGTQARVEIGNASTWSACTFREIQKPSNWNSSQIAISMNNGMFTNGVTAYVYVVDSSGAVNSNGYPITIGAGSTVTPPDTTNQPAAPRGLAVL